jgi:hypothetical protein
MRGGEGAKMGIVQVFKFLQFDLNREIGNIMSVELFVKSVILL